MEIPLFMLPVIASEFWWSLVHTKCCSKYKLQAYRTRKHLGSEFCIIWAVRYYIRIDR